MRIGNLRAHRRGIPIVPWRNCVLCAILWGVWVGVGCSNSNLSATRTSLQAISNRDVRWGGNFNGLAPRYSKAFNGLLEKANAKEISGLLDALEDKDRYVAAHVLLTRNMFAR